VAIDSLAPAPALLLAGIALDAVFGDPRYALHPVRLMGRTLTAFEKLLRRCGLNGYAGGCLLFLLLVLVWVAVPSAAVALLDQWSLQVAAAVHVFAVFSLVALRDLVDHVQAVVRPARQNDVGGARSAIAMLVGRDTTKMDLDACRRAAIESLSENFVDGYVSAIFWYVLLGLPGLLLFKVVSTMDSMVGYKTPPYLYFGWCGARTDDVMNYIPSRLSWLVLGLCALPFPGLSARKGWKWGLAQHALVPGPNSGWSEATMAGLLQRRLIGPIWKEGAVVTELWLGDPSDPPGGSEQDISRAIRVTILAALVVAGVGIAVI
jgi:adenosylcobinamide-phosphate synthase